MAAVVDRLKARWQQAREQHSSVDVAAKSWTRLNDTNGNLYAGAITYFSFLALFPLLLLAVSIMGFVLDPSTLNSVFHNIATKVPGSVGKTLSDSIAAAVDSKAGVGIVGLVGVLLTGLGWIANLRRAIDAIWQRQPAERNFLVERLSNLLVLVGLGAGLLLSVGITAVWTAAANEILSLLHLDDVPGMGTLLGVAGVVVAMIGDAVVFLWLVVRLPVVEVPRAVGIRAALLGAVGFEVLKIVGTYTVAHTANSPTAGPFAGILAVLIWIQLVVRWFLFVVAVTAVLTERAAAAEAAVAASADPGAGPDRVGAPVEAASAPSPAAVGATLVGAGAAIGAAAVALATRRAHSRD